MRDLTEAFNGNVEKLNSRISAYLDYAVNGDKGQFAFEPRCVRA